MLKKVVLLSVLAAVAAVLTTTGAEAYWVRHYWGWHPHYYHYWHPHYYVHYWHPHYWHRFYY